MARRATADKSLAATAEPSERDGTVDWSDDTVSTPNPLARPPPGGEPTASSNLDLKGVKLDVVADAVGGPATASSTGGTTKLRDGAALPRAEYALPLAEEVPGGGAPGAADRSHSGAPPKASLSTRTPW